MCLVLLEYYLSLIMIILCADKCIFILSFKVLGIFKGAQSRLNGLKSLAKLFNFVVFNPCQSSPSLSIFFPLCFVIISLVFFYLCKVLFSGYINKPN